MLCLLYVSMNKKVTCENVANPMFRMNLILNCMDLGILKQGLDWLSLNCGMQVIQAVPILFKGIHHVL
jgi:hypothetical protein